MKQYFAFYGDCYYPSGGMDDFIGDFDTKEEAFQAIKKEYAKIITYDSFWCQIWDTVNNIEVFRG
jgi:hypothetical protein